jgi:hypothetical protein
MLARPLKPTAGVKRTWPPTTLAAPAEALTEAEATVRSPCAVSMSVSFARTTKSVAGAPKSTAPVSSTATGASFTHAMSTLTLELELPPLPSLMS